MFYLVIPEIENKGITYLLRPVAVHAYCWQERSNFHLKVDPAKALALLTLFGQGHHLRGSRQRFGRIENR